MSYKGRLKEKIGKRKRRKDSGLWGRGAEKGKKK